MRKNILIIFIVIIMLIVLPLSLAFSKGGYKSIPRFENIDIFNEIEKAYNQEGKIEVSEELINSILAQVFKKSLNKRSILIEDGYFYINDDRINLCLKLSYKGKTFYPNLSAKLEYSDEGLIVYDTRFKIGKLLLPKSILIDSIKKHENDYLKVADDKIIISKYFIPFNINNVYIKDKKIVIVLNKDFKISNNDEKNKQPDKAYKTDKIGKNINTNSSSSLINNKNSRKSTSNKNLLMNNKPNVNGTSDNIKMLLSSVKSQLNTAISSAKTSKEKKILQTIQNVVGEVSKNPSYQYKAEAYKVISDYKSLNPEEKERVKKAILNNVDTRNVIKLISIFGL
ncbi:MAG: hypothetical protein N2448_07580 [Caloramator sp.]|nr:hypothetical protein [Caloramator sp.]